MKAILKITKALVIPFLLIAALVLFMLDNYAQIPTDITDNI